MSSSEQSALTIVGAGAGFLIGGPTGALYGAQIGYSIGASSLSTTLPPTEGPRLGDLRAQTASYGWNIPKSWGTVGHAGAVIWSSGIQETRNTVTQEQGGKGAPSTSQSHTTFSYSASFAVLFHDGPITAVRRIWANEFIVYDAGSVDDYGTLTDAELTDWTVAKAVSLRDGDGGLKIYNGTESQTADPTIQAHEGANNTPAYRGQAYVVFTDLQLDRFGNRLPQIRVEYIAVDSSVSATASNVRSIDFSNIDNTPNVWAQKVICVEDDLTAHFVSGNFSSGKTVTDLRYYTIMPSGSISYKKTLTIPNPFNGQIAGCYSEYPSFVVCSTIASSSTTRLALVQPFGALHEPGASFFGELTASNLPINATNYLLRQSFSIIGGQQTGKILWRIDSLNNGTWFRLFEYTKSVDISLLGDVSTVLSDNIFDFEVSPGYVLGFALTNNYIYVLYTNDSTLEIYNHSGVLVDTWTGGPATLTATRAGVYADSSDDGVFYFWSGDVLHRYVDGVYEYIGLVISHDAEIGDPGYIKNGLFVYQCRDDTAVVIDTFGAYNKAGAPLSDVVSDLCEESGLDPADYDTTALAGITVDGYTKSRNSSATSNINALMQAYQFSAYEDENKVVFKLRGGNVDKTIDPDDLASGIDRASAQILPYSRLDDQSLPLRVDVKYLDYILEYDVGLQSSQRSAIYDTSQVMDVSLPIVLDADTARQVAEKIHSAVWTARVDYKDIRLPLKYLDIVPTDIIDVTVDGTYHKIRVTAVNIGEFIEITGIAEDSADYTSLISGQEQTRAYKGANYPGPSELYFLDLPPLRNQDGDDGYYLAAHGYYSGWGGCVVYSRNADGGWSKVASVVGASPAGVCIGSLPDADANVIDYESSLIVGMRAGSLSSVTKSQMLADRTVNAAAVGVHGRWEVIQYQTATDNGDGTYTLTGLVRGLGGTESNMATHEDGDLFVVLNSSVLSRAYTSDLNTQTQYRAVSIGTTFQSGTDIYFSNTGQATKPLSPVHLAATDNGDGTFDLSWIRRTRTFGEWADNKDVPVSEVDEEYTILVYDNSSPRVLANSPTSITASTNSATITASPGYLVRVAQVSDFYGPGEYAELIL